MTRPRDEGIDLSRLDVDAFLRLLQRNGWTRRGGQAGAYSRWAAEDATDEVSIIVPHDRQRDDYEELLQAAVDRLARSPVPAARHVYTVIKAPGDEVRWQKQVATEPGLIPWSLGEELILSAKHVLVAAAKATRGTLPYYGQRHWGFAKHFLDTVLMGQTQASSYVVTTFTPAGPVSWEERETQATRSGRDVLQTMFGALTAIREAIEHYQSSSSLTGFDAGVPSGVSYELTRALVMLLREAEGARISVDWTPSVPSPPTVVQTDVEFTPADIEPLREGGSKLASIPSTEVAVVVGAVTALDRPILGRSGVVRLNVLYGTAAKHVRVRLEGQQYNEAIAAHKEGDLLRITGSLERSGKVHWLRDALDVGRVEAQEMSRTDGFGLQ